MRGERVTVLRAFLYGKRLKITIVREDEGDYTSNGHCEDCCATGSCGFDMTRVKKRKEHYDREARRRWIRPSDTRRSARPSSRRKPLPSAVGKSSSSPE